jgi:hypothetical protein
MPGMLVRQQTGNILSKVLGRKSSRFLQPIGAGRIGSRLVISQMEDTLQQPPAKKRRKAKKQVLCAEPAPSSDNDPTKLPSYIDKAKLKELRSLYGSEKDGGVKHISQQAKHRIHAGNRVSIKRDTGVTEGEEDGQVLFCIDFARGKCPDGYECTHLHRAPTIEDDYTAVSQTHDIFGRARDKLLTDWEKHSGKKEDGWDDVRNTTIFVGGLMKQEGARSKLCGGSKNVSSEANTDKAVRKCFNEFGELYEVSILFDGQKRVATCTYVARACAEFAKEAMSRQSLRVDGSETLSIMWATKKQGARSGDGYQYQENYRANHVPLPPPTSQASAREGVKPAGTAGTAGTVGTAGTAGTTGTSGTSVLAPGWKFVQGANGGRGYYWHQTTNQVTWDRPGPVPPPPPPPPVEQVLAAVPAAVPAWTAVTDEASGEVYYWNEQTNQTVWEKPADMA